MYILHGLFCFAYTIKSRPIVGGDTMFGWLVKDILDINKLYWYMQEDDETEETEEETEEYVYIA